MEIKDYFVGKVRLDEHGSGYFFDEENNMIADLRGWGRIQNLFMKNGKFIDNGNEQAENFQDQVGKFIADAINEKLKRDKYLRENLIAFLQKKSRNNDINMYKNAHELVDEFLKDINASVV